MAKTVDVAIIGATAAGLSAAIALARLKRSVVVVDSPPAPLESPLAEWAPNDLFPEAPFLKSIIKNAAAEPFTHVRFHSAEGSSSAHYRSSRPAGYLFQHGKLVAALRAVAKTAKVNFVSSEAWPELDLQENAVALAAKKPIQSQLLLVAENQPADVASMLSLPFRSAARPVMTVVGVDIAWTAQKIKQHFGPDLHIVGQPSRHELGMFFAVGRFLHVRLIRYGRHEGKTTADLSAMVGRLRRAGLLPPDLPLGDLHAAVWHPPAGVGLEMETHVAKRTLLIGAAGGFADLLTGQTLAPAIRSALLAAQVADRALNAPANIQNVLGAFKDEWRQTLADRLRPPNTALHLLMPLVFVNQEMANRFARAILYGESM